MNLITKSSNDIIQSGKNSLFHKFKNGEFIINSPCIFSQNQIITRNVIYDLIDLKETGGMQLTKFKFMNAYLRGFDFFVVGIDIISGLILKRHNRFDYYEQPCDWFLIAQGYLQPVMDAKGIEDYCVEN